MVINSTSGFQAVYEQMLKLKDAARKSGLFYRHGQRVSTSTNRWVRIR